MTTLRGGNAITLDGTRFRDREGRQVILRGVNFGGDCKIPAVPDGRTFLPTDFADHRTVSFVGRPAPLDEIDAHLGRIAHWGFNCLRLLTTWEAIEHAGPGQYDEAYLDYYAEVCRRASAHGLHVFVDFHQDVWSRMSGGDGAPGWTFEAAGLEFTKFDAADAAHLMQAKYDVAVGGRQASYPAMSWGGNYRMPANGIMWTLFFAGADFAPGAMVEGRNIQHWLQDHYCGAMSALAERISDIDMVIGFDTLNEPGSGYIGRAMTAPLSRLFGAAWTPLDGLAAASGISREVELLQFGGASAGSQSMNAAGVSIWLPGYDDPFRANGAWDIASDGTAVPVREGYFEQVYGRSVELGRDYMAPFFHRVADTVRTVRDDWLIFAEVDPFGAMRGETFPADCPERTVNASHWYDLATLVTKRFDPARTVDLLTGAAIEGEAAIENSYTAGLAKIRAIGDSLGSDGAPTLIGEFGIPFDMNDGEAFERWNAGERDSQMWRAQESALTLMYNALDRLLLSSTQWNYTVTNRNDAMIGDGWNQEDLSIWSTDQCGGEITDPDTGGRAVAGFCRPFAHAVQGTIVSQTYDIKERRFGLVYDADARVSAPTRIFLPTSMAKAKIELLINGTVQRQGVQPGLIEIRKRNGRVSLVLRW